MQEERNKALKKYTKHKFDKILEKRKKIIR